MELTTLENTKPDFDQYGFRHQQNLIQAFIGGSQMHGAKLEGTDDTDWYGVYVEPRELKLGLDMDEHFVYTTGGERGGNKPGDTDVCLYSLGKWAGLAAKGNPSVLHFLFAPPVYENFWWHNLVLPNREKFLARNHIGQFLGFANAQMQRLLNQRGGKDCHRPFLEEQHGYDTKYAMHIIRLLGEATEMMETGHITLPRPNREELIRIRKGEFKLYELKNWANDLEVQALAAADKSQLPQKVDRKVISELVTDVYWEYYRDHPQKRVW